MASVAREVGGLRIAAAVIDGIGALVGAAKGGLAGGGWLFVALMMSDLTNRVSLLLIGSESATAIFGLLGMVGAGLVLAGRKLGAWLMLTGGAGVVASTLAYPLFLPIVMAPVVNATGEPVDYPSAGHYLIGFTPAVLLLLGAALAFLDRRYQRS